MYDLILIGYGIAHMSLLLALSAHTTTINVCIIDPYFDGGDLSRHWYNVKSNTTWQQFLDAVRPYCSIHKIRALEAQMPAEDTVHLGTLVRAYESVVRAAVAFPVERIFGTASAAEYANDTWTVVINKRTVNGRRISYAPGANPKSLSYPVPQLSLESVLSPGLDIRVRRGDRVVVFGLSHSGTLAVDALLRCGSSVVAVYNTSKPFQYDRDGVYGGIKQESAVIADRILANGECTLIRADDVELLKVLMTANWVVYAIGFEPRSLDFKVNGVQQELTYDPTTGIANMPAASFWGIAYPNSTQHEGSTYYDVSLAAFLAHCEKNVSRLLDERSILA
jgi:hypothetical protein